MIEVARAEIEEALRQALPAVGAVTRCAPLLKGHAHQSFVLATSSNVTLLLKIALRREQLGQMQSLHHVLELTAQHGVPAPRVLHFCEGTAVFGQRPWLIQEFLTGEDGEDAIVGMSATRRATFFRDFGRAVARLHAIDLGYFAEDLAGSKREETWAAVVESRLERLAERHRQAGLLHPHSLEAARDAVLAAARMVSGIRPALVHRDLYLPNTLVSAGRFRCLLDFEHARSADALSDFVKLKMWVFDRIPGSEAEFCSGYGANPLTMTTGRLRHHVALGLELLAGLVYWKTTGQSNMLADYETRFRAWLTAPPAGRP